MRVLGGLLLGTALVTVPLHAQRTTLTVSGFPVVFAAPTAADLDGGTLSSSTATTFTVEVTAGQPIARLTTVSIRCQAPCPATGSMSMAALLWRRADLGVWTPLTTMDVPIESRIVGRRLPLPQSNNPWSNSLYWQALADWTSNAPGANTFNIVMTLTVTTP
jgi:hypothetical protein